MKNSRTAIAALVLVLVLFAPALAGEIHTDSPTPLLASGQTQAAATDGEMHTDAATSTPTTDTVAEAALDLLQNLLTLF
jgi:hypothetical protein